MKAVRVVSEAAVNFGVDSKQMLVLVVRPIKVAILQQVFSSKEHLIKVGEPP